MLNDFIEPLGTRKNMADRRGMQTIDDLEKKRDDFVLVLGWIEGRAIELRAEIEKITREISSEIRQRGRSKN